MNMEKFGEAINTPESTASTDILEPKKERVQREKKHEERLEKEENQEAPEGWMTALMLSEETGRTPAMIERLTQNYKEIHPEWFDIFKRNNRRQEHYSPELLKIVLDKFDEFKRAPDNWLTGNGLAENLGINRETITKLVKPFISTNPEYFEKFLDGKYQPAIHFSPELIKIIENITEKYKKPLDGWMTAKVLGKELNKDAYTSVRKQALIYAKENP